MHECDVGPESDEDREVIDEELSFSRVPGGGSSETQGERDARQVVEREQSEDPGASGVPPHVVARESTSVGGVQHEPDVVPQRAPGEVHRAGEKLALGRPHHAREERNVEDHEGEEEHEQVVAGERLAAHDHAVQLPEEPGGAVPGRRLVRPPVLPFALDLQAGQDGGED